LPKPQESPKRQDPGGPPSFEQVFRSETVELGIERARLLITSALFIYLGFWFLDLVVAGDQATRFLIIRLTVSVFYVAGLIALRSRLAGWLAETVVFIGGLASAAGISEMASSLGGYSSNYFVGNMIVIVAAGYFMPWALRTTAAFLVFSILSYPAFLIPQHGFSREMIAPLFFLTGMALFTYVAAAFNQSDRRRDLSLRMRLQEANKELKRVDAAKTRFFANVSHELRTPLTLMLGPVETLRHEESDKERRVLLESVLTNSRRLLRQVNLLLDSAKLEADQLVLEPTEGDLEAILNELILASKPHAEGKDIELVTEGLEGLDPFSFDVGKIEMVAANLLSNALKFTPAGGRIVVRALPGAESSVFEVEDTGPGIPEEQQSLIFERFHQVDTSLSREEGTGLGLSLARELVRLHGGSLGVTSEPGKGSIFRVEIPKHSTGIYPERRSKQRRREDQMAQVRAETLTAREYKVRSRTEMLLADLHRPRIGEEVDEHHEGPERAPLVLIVDDNADLRAFLSRQLSKQFRVETASDGQDGLDKARHRRPSLIVSDVMMPRMDGYEFCRRLKEDAGLANIPIILVTAKAGSEAIVEGLDIGADDYVTKPFSTEELEARIAAHLRAKETEHELHEKESRLAAIGQLTSGVVHDVRNALMLIQGYSDLARSTAVEGGSREDLLKDIDEIKGATKRLQRMSSEILDFARGGSELNRVSLPVLGYLGPVLERLVTHLKGQGIEVESEIDLREDTLVSIDQDRFQRVLENLVFNARDALLEHSGERTVLFQVGRRGDSIEIRVADTGPGIAAEIADRLFEPFMSKKLKGTGLGLPTVRNLVKAHGGEIRVEPRAPEGGAAFTVVLPIIAAAAPLRLVSTSDDT
jgi:signal transduction histidine kinase